MSTIKDLKNSPENSINIIDALKLFAPKGKSKYLTLINSLMRKSMNFDEESEKIKNHLKAIYKFEDTDFEGLQPLQLVLMDRAIFSMFDELLLTKFQKFCDYNERGLISKNDLTTYNGFDEIYKEVVAAELKEVEKELESHIIKIYDDGEWLVLKPLTHLSSKKYGAGTKWCTSSEHEKDYFERYSRDGILIYIINRKTNYKVACYRNLSEREVSFWDVLDTRIDSIQTELPLKIMDIVKSEVLNNLVPNNSLITKDIKKQKLLGLFNKPNLIRKESYPEQPPLTPRNMSFTGMTVQSFDFDNEIESVDECKSDSRIDGESLAFANSVLLKFDKDVQHLPINMTIKRSGDIDSNNESESPENDSHIIEKSYPTGTSIRG